jgi:hypothetical protein
MMDVADVLTQIKETSLSTLPQWIDKNAADVE